MNEVRMYCTAICPYCIMAERLLRQKGVVKIEKLRIDLDPSLRQEMLDKTRRRTVPQIFVGDFHVGGFDDLAKLNHAGQLDGLLNPDTDTDTSSHAQQT
jgi:glutaredoxin 3